MTRFTNEGNTSSQFSFFMHRSITTSPFFSMVRLVSLKSMGGTGRKTPKII